VKSWGLGILYGKITWDGISGFRNSFEDGMYSNLTTNESFRIEDEDGGWRVSVAELENWGTGARNWIIILDGWEWVLGLETGS
jgi:hypothetical protein